MNDYRAKLKLNDDMEKFLSFMDVYESYMGPGTCPISPRDFDDVEVSITNFQISDEECENDFYEVLLDNGVSVMVELEEVVPI